MPTPTEKFKSMLSSGEISTPADFNEMSRLLDRHESLVSHSFDLDEEIDIFKLAFLNMHRIKSGNKKYCYISAIKQGVMKKRFKILDDVVWSLYETDLMTYTIQRLIVEGKISLSVKKVFLSGDHHEQS